jgi:glycine/D-amino acid oxidase-like deaminating enzyme
MQMANSSGAAKGRARAPIRKIAKEMALDKTAKMQMADRARQTKHKRAKKYKIESKIDKDKTTMVDRDRDKDKTAADRDKENAVKMEAKTRAVDAARVEAKADTMASIGAKLKLNPAARPVIM